MIWLYEMQLFIFIYSELLQFPFSFSLIIPFVPLGWDLDHGKGIPAIVVAAKVAERR